MKERPIIFSSPMVRAILDGRKSQTRRIVKKQISDIHKFQGWIIGSTDKKRDGCASWGIGEGSLIYDLVVARCPYGQPGDRLWVRESYMPDPADDGTWAYTQYMGCKGSPLSDIPMKFRRPENCIYRATWDGSELVGWKPSIHMPRWASRILLEVTNVRVERLHDISEEDAIAEGLKAITKDGKTIKYGIPDRDGYPGNDDTGWDWCDWNVSPVSAYKMLWESINGQGSWDLNPFCWVIEFKVISK